MAFSFSWTRGSGTATGTNTGDETATRIGALIGGSGDATPNDTDFVATSLTAGGILKKITWTNVKIFLANVFAPKVSYIRLLSDYVAASDGSFQKIFNSTTNGAFTAKANTHYEFYCRFDIDSLSGTTGILFGFQGTATISEIIYDAIGRRTAVGTAGLFPIYKVATASQVTSSSTSATAQVIVFGYLTTTDAGTIIPSFKTSIASAATIKAFAEFTIKELGTNIAVSTSDFT